MSLRQRAAIASFTALLALAACKDRDANYDFDGDGTIDSLDCEPENADIHPGAEEICDDGIDNDCDEDIDLEDSDCPGGDDDTGDDDDSGDDDSGDDDDSAAGEPEYWAVGVQLSASGGDQGGSASIDLSYHLHDTADQPLCTIDLAVTAVYDYGGLLGDDYFQYIDELLEWYTAVETSNDCPPKWQPYGKDPGEDLLWSMTNPLAFVSCEVVANAIGLGTTPLGEDIFTGMPYAGDFDAYCDDIGPHFSPGWGGGATEAIWMMPGEDGALDTFGTFQYFQPPSQLNVEYWMVAGILYAEPGGDGVEGLNGSYEAYPFWTIPF